MPSSQHTRQSRPRGAWERSACSMHGQLGELTAFLRPPLEGHACLLTGVLQIPPCAMPGHTRHCWHCSWVQECELHRARGFALIDRPAAARHRAAPGTDAGTELAGWWVSLPMPCLSMGWGNAGNPHLCMCHLQTESSVSVAGAEDRAATVTLHTGVLLSLPACWLHG